MAATISFLDMSVSATPPGGHFEPIPITLGANNQPNDVRILFITASGASDSITLTMPMEPDPPTGFTAGYSLDPGFETQGAYYRRLLATDTSTSIALPKPNQYRHYMLGLLTARGVSPTVNPVAGALAPSYTVGNANATLASVTVPAAGVMVFFLGSIPDPGGGWPAWAVSMNAPTGWTNLVATDKSGSTFYPFDTNPGILVVAKTYTGSGSTGTVSVPVAPGAPAFAGMYMFFQAGADVSVVVGAA